MLWEKSSDSKGKDLDSKTMAKVLKRFIINCKNKIGPSEDCNQEAKFLKIDKILDDFSKFPCENRLLYRGYVFT